MASLLQNLLGGGVKPESQGRRKATSVGDRDVASRDTVYRKPAARSDTTSSTKKPASGGGKKSSGGGGFKLPRTAPIPTPDTRSTFPARPETVAAQMPQMPPPLAGLPLELQDTGMPVPDPRLAGPPPMGAAPPTFPARPETVAAQMPQMPPPLNGPPPDLRDQLTAQVGKRPQPPQQQGSMLPGEDYLNQWGKQHLPWWLGGG